MSFDKELILSDRISKLIFDNSTKEELKILKHSFLTLSPISFLLKENLEDLRTVIMDPGEDGTYPVLTYTIKLTTILELYLGDDISTFLDKYISELESVTGETSSLFITDNSSKSKRTQYRYTYKYEKILHIISILQRAIVKL